MTAASREFVREALFNGNGIAKKLIVAVVLFSSLITAAITALELHAQYRRDIKQIERAFEFISARYLPALAEQVWVADGVQVQLMLDGLQQLPDLEFLGVIVDGQPRWTAGKAVAAHTRTIAVPMVRQHRGQPLTFATLQIVASVDRVMARIWDQLLLVLVSNGIKTLLVAGFLLFVFQWLVTRHLTSITRYVRGLDPRAPRGEQVTLARAPTGRWRPDMLDAVAGALNRMSTSLQAAQFELRDSEARYRAIVELQDDAVCRWRPDTTLTFTNAAYRGLFDRGSNGFDGRKWLDFVPEAERDNVAAFYRQLAQEPRRNAYEHSAVAADGSSRWIAWIDVPLFDAAGDLVEFQSVGRDITQRKRDEEAIRDLNQSLEERVRERTAELARTAARAERASRAKSEFLSRMSHELRTPMNAILGFAQILELSNPTDQQRGWAKEIRQAGDHLLQLIDELLDLSQIEIGKLKMRVAAHDLTPIVDEAVAIVRSALTLRDIDLQLHPCREPATVLVDRTRLRQILVNFLSNAVKYNHPGGRVEVRCETLGARELRLKVIDNGIGIAADRLTDLFQPFERLGAENRGIEGTGIGLALCKQIAELMGASVGAVSVPEAGSTFWIDLPRGPAPVLALLDTSATSETAFAREVSVLYVEDNPANLELVRVLLEPHRAVRLITAADGATGLAQAQAQHPDLILLDIRMPQLDGYAVLLALKADARTRFIPVVALSANAMPQEIERGLAAGFVRYLVKPVPLQVLLSVIADFAPQPHLGIERRAVVGTG